MSISNRRLVGIVWWGVLSLGLGTSWLAGCQGPGETSLEPGLERLEGELEIRIADFPDGTSEERFLLRPRDGGRPQRLHFSERPQLGPGTSLSVVGARTGDGLTVVRFDRLLEQRGLEELRGQSLVGASPLPKRRLAFVLVDLGQGVNITVDEARRKAFGMAPGDQSMKQVVLEYSFGRQDLDGEVVGPIKGTMQGCDEDGLADSLRSQIPPGFDNIVWYLGKRVGACGWAGVAPLGRANRIAGQLWVNGTASCAVATHEFGHNLGLQHAARMRCTGGVSLHDTPQGNCTASEYGDSSDVMGDGCNHVGGYSKSYLNWFEKCNGVLARQSGTFTLFPVERACNGIQVLHVPMPKERMFGGTALRNYYLELRAPIGLDARLMPQVQVRVGASLPPTGSAKKTFILDTNPMSPAIDGLKLGEMFQDPAGGVRIKVDAIDVNSATVTVEIDSPATPGAPTCLDGTPLMPPGPQSCGDGAQATPATPTMPGPDAGAAGPGPVRDAGGSNSGTGGGGPGGGNTGTGGAAGGAAPGGESPPPAPSGCTCRVGERRGSGGALGWLAMVAAASLVARRRRRR